MARARARPDCRYVEQFTLKDPEVPCLLAFINSEADIVRLALSSVLISPSLGRSSGCLPAPSSPTWPPVHSVLSTGPWRSQAMRIGIPGGRFRKRAQDCASALRPQFVVCELLRPGCPSRCHWRQWRCAPMPSHEWHTSQVSNTGSRLMLGRGR